MLLSKLIHEIGDGLADAICTTALDWDGYDDGHRHINTVTMCLLLVCNNYTRSTVHDNRPLIRHTSSASMQLPLLPRWFLGSTWELPSRYPNRYLRQVRMKLILPEKGGRGVDLKTGCFQLWGLIDVRYPCVV